jgi:hypothetical protein
METDLWRVKLTYPASVNTEKAREQWRNELREWMYQNGVSFFWEANHTSHVVIRASGQDATLIKLTYI